MKVLKQKDLKSYRDKQLKINNIDRLTGRVIEKPCLDHDHTSGYCRRILDYNSNQFLGKIESARKRFLYKFKDSEIPDILRRAAKYLEEDYTNNPVHPKYINILVSRFSRFNISKQEQVLLANGVSISDQGKTKELKIKQYRKILMAPNNIYKV